MKEFLKSIPPLRRAVRSGKAVLADLKLESHKRKLFGSLAKMVPPPRFMHDGPANYQSFYDNGREFFDIFTRECGLSPQAKILDVGSGIGRKTIPLTQFLAKNGSYDGIDIVKKGINWCQSHISRRHPNFRFQHIDVYSKFYNPKGAVRSSDFRFPFADASFDFVILTSVFTHMVKADMDHYMGEIKRVLKVGGTCLISYLLINDESNALFDQWTWKLLPNGDESMVLDQNDPEHLIAHPESLVRAQFAKHGLTIENTAYGSWCGRKEFRSFQDLIIARR